MTTYSGTPPKATSVTTGSAEIRCAGRLRCDCGARVKALDIEIQELDNELELGIERVKLICSNCHSDLLEVAL